MLYTAAVTIAALLASVALTLAGGGVPVAVLHLAFAVGIVPLIFAAMSHFVPVLTRSGGPDRAIRLLPAAAQAAGLLAVAAMQGWTARWTLHVAAGIDLFLAASLLGWMAGRARDCVGSPHPGWRWYGAALAAFALALAAVPPLVTVPALYGPLRAFHLHLNTLGWVGLAALGTLPVLLPTALGEPDPGAAHWLRRHQWPATGAVLAVAFGAAFSFALGVLAAMVLLAVVGGLGWQWRRRFGLAALWRDGAAASLGTALLGLLLLALAGIAHAAALLPARPAIAAWVAGFLLPLVTGALSQLLPVWRWPGPVTPARGRMRERLTSGGRWRALLFLSGAGALLAGWSALGEGLAAAALLAFALGMLRAVRVPATAR